MKSFSFILSPISIKQLKVLCPILRILPDLLIKPFLKNNAPFKACQIKRIQSIQGTQIQGNIIICPLLPKQMLESDEGLVLESIISAGHLAERLGAKIIGLGGYAGIVADKGLTVAKSLKIPVTTGKSLTAWSVFEAIFRVARAKGIDLKKSTLSIVGAGGSLGYLCAAKLSDYVMKIKICDGNKDKLIRLKERVLEFNPIEISIEEGIGNAIKDADILINATRSPETLFSLDLLKSGAIICDVSASWNIADSPNSRSDITIVKGGLIKAPNSDSNFIPASLAETMLLTLEEKFTSYSLGDNINLDKLEEIANLAVRHGFEVWVPQAPVL